MKVIIPVAGVGSKLRPHTHTQPKALVPVAGKPILSHIIDFLLEEGLNDFVFIVGYMGSRIKRFLTEHYEHKNIKMSFVLQEPREGSAHALWVARDEFKKEKELLILLGDTITKFNLKELLNKKGSVVGVQKVSEPWKVGIAEISSKGEVKKMVEKPKIPKSNMGLVGIYKLANVKLFLDSLKEHIGKKLDVNSEYHITDTLMKMISKGEKFSSINVDTWFDCGKKENLLKANAILLSRMNLKRPDEGYYPNTIIIPPVKIGDDCILKNSIIGPNVVIGNNTTIDDCLINNSIIGNFSKLESLILDNSLMGNDTHLKGVSKQLNIGDNTEINFGK